MDLLLLFIGAIFVNNILMTKFLGVCPFLGVSKKVETAFGMGLAVTFVMTIASIFSYLVYNYLLVPLHIEFLYTIAFILVIASLVQLVEMVIQKSSPTLYQALGVYLPLITTNCAVLGIAVLNMQNKLSFIGSIVSGFGTAIGFTLAMVILASIREKNEYNNIPKAFAGYPSVLLTAGLMAMAFLGFQGLIK